MSIDIGVLHMGVIRAAFEHNWSLRKLVFSKLINLVNLRHERVPFDECTLYHSNEACDRVDHLIQEYKEEFDACDILLIERQPPAGLTNLEQLLFKAFRHKAILVSPNSMHSYFGIRDLDYDERKVAVTKLAEETYKTNPELHEEFKELIRQHDLGDAAAHLKKFAEEKAEEYKREQLAQELRKKHDLQRYMYRPLKKSKYFAA